MTAQDRGSFYEFFAGGGMARAGLGSGWQCLFANDIDEKKAESYALNWGFTGLLVKDVSRLTTESLPGQAELAWASFPCQDLSLAGCGAGLQGDRSGTFWPFWRLIEGLRREDRAPALIVIENVCGALTSHDGRDFGSIATAIEREDYSFGAVVVDAVDFVPQSRPRLFVIAVRQGVPIPTHLTDAWPSRKWHTPALIAAYGKLASKPKARWLWWNLPRPAPRDTVFADLIEESPRNVKWHTQTETKSLLSLMSPVNRRKVRAAQKAGRPMVGAVYKRTRPDGNGGRAQRAEVRFDDIAGCLRTPAGGSSRQLLMLVDGDSIRSRLLSPREAARLMGLPDTYELPENYNEAYHLAGDGLVVPVIRHLAAHILEPILASARSQNKAAA